MDHFWPAGQEFETPDLETNCNETQLEMHQDWRQYFILINKIKTWYKFIPESSHTHCVWPSFMGFDLSWEVNPVESHQWQSLWAKAPLSGHPYLQFIQMLFVFRCCQLMCLICFFKSNYKSLHQAQNKRQNQLFWPQAFWKIFLLLAAVVRSRHSITDVCLKPFFINSLWSAAARMSHVLKCT